MSSIPFINDPPKLCECGCGKPTQISKENRSRRGYTKVKGQPNRFLPGHNLRPSRPMEERFWAKVDIGAPDECWLWTASVMKDGYGSFSQTWRTPRRAHCLSWELANGPIPQGLWVLHHCDVRRCVNPAHLFVGTPKDNTQDMMRKGRHRFGRGKK